MPAGKLGLGITVIVYSIDSEIIPFFFSNSENIVHQ